MPVPKGQRLGRQKRDLTRFGIYIERFCCILHTSQHHIERAARLSRGDISSVTRSSGKSRRPTPELVARIWQGIEHLASAQGMRLSDEVRAGFWNAAGYATEEQQDHSVQVLAAFEEQIQ